MAVLPNSIYSPDHLRFCLSELRAYAGLLEQRDRGAGVVVPELSMESLDLLTEMKGADRNRADVVAALADELERHLEAAPTISLTLAATAPRALKLELVSWLRSNTRRELMVEFLVNPDISGGMVVRTANKVFDCSWRTRLLDNSDRFVPILEAS